MSSNYTTARVERSLYFQFVDRVRRLEGSVSLSEVMARLIKRYMSETEHLITQVQQEALTEVTPCFGKAQQQFEKPQKGVA